MQFCYKRKSQTKKTHVLSKFNVFCWAEFPDDLGHLWAMGRGLGTPNWPALGVPTAREMATESLTAEQIKAPGTCHLKSVTSKDLCRTSSLIVIPEASSSWHTGTANVWLNYVNLTSPY